MPIVERPAPVSVNKILLATDFSSVSEKTAAYARLVAKRFASEVEIVHIFTPSTVNSYEEAALVMPEEMKRGLEGASLEEVRTGFADAGIEAKAILRNGHFPSSDLLKIAEEDDIDLIVAGTTSRKGVGRLLLGSTAEDLIRRAECPVLTVGPLVDVAPDKPLSFERIVYATDFSPETAKAALLALSFAEDSGARLYFCYILEHSSPSTEMRDLVDGAFKKALQRMVPESSYDWCSPEFIVEHGDAAEQILGVARRVRADLIVLGARRPSFWLSHFGGGVTPALLSEAHCPVMTISREKTPKYLVESQNKEVPYDELLR